jgi:conserved oligomeric Golgi complex subunit 3
VLQRGEARIRSAKSDEDPDLFMVKNLLILKNELVSLEIGDIRSHAASMQHFGRIWETMSPSSWMGFFGGLVGGVTGTSLWSRNEGKAAVTAKTLTVQDVNEQLDELLRQSIYSFTRRWGAQINDATSGKPGAKPLAKIEKELGRSLSTAFGGQPEVVAKLREAIQINARALKEADGQTTAKTGARRY